MTFCGFFNLSWFLLPVNLRVVAFLPPSSVVTFGQLHTPPRRTRLTITSNLVHCALIARCQHTTQLYNPLRHCAHDSKTILPRTSPQEST